MARKRKTKVDPDPWGTIATVCFSCSKATAVLCEFMGANSDFGEVLKRMGADYVTKDSSKQHGVLYKVTFCPSYERGNIPKRGCRNG